MELVYMAWYSLVSHKLRSLLTMLGITIGVGSIIAVVAIGKGGEASLSSKLSGDKELQSDLIFTPHTDAPERIIMHPPTYTPEDIRAISQLADVKDVIRFNSTSTVLTYGSQRVELDVHGGDSYYPSAHQMSLLSGSWEDINLANNSGVWLNDETTKRLFPDGSALGKIVRCNSVPLQVRGVYEEKGFSIGSTPSAFVSLTLWSQLFGTQDVQNLSITASSDERLSQAEKAAISYLNSHKDTTYGTYEIFSSKELNKSLTAVGNVMTWVISSIAGISLMVGGVGVMNIMLVSVTERTREIGIRKALGASRRAIMLQFLVESMVLTSLGGGMGIGLGVAGAFIVSYFAKWPPLISPWVILGAVVFSMALGILFGALPASRASKMPPIEALSYE